MRENRKRELDLCPECAALVARGEEKKRVEVLKEAGEMLYTPDNIIGNMTSLRPPSPPGARCSGYGDRQSENVRQGVPKTT